MDVLRFSIAKGKNNPPLGNITPFRRYKRKNKNSGERFKDE